MVFIWEQLPLAAWLVSLIFILGMFGILYFVFAKIVRRKVGYVFVSIASFLAIASFLMGLFYVFILAIGITAVGVALALFANLGDLRSFLANPFKISRVKNAKLEVEKVYSRKELYDAVDNAVMQLSKTRTGAIMTFEKNTSLEDVIKNGVIVNAPLTSELLQTIFYPGTRLHDGAVVIRDNMIIAASVFFTPTTKPFAGKYGSRHRAALGISEISDCITVVVSEETGRISFAVNGELEPVTQDMFRRVFENYMEGVSQQ